ncbi:MAG: GerMN domain-containing protein [Rectinemataceae bacterium]
MKGFFSRVPAAIGSLATFVSVLVTALARWLAPPRHFLPTLLGLCFVFSLASWSLGDRRTPFVLYFPTLDGSADRGERRDIPWKSDAESQAEAIASEFLLGPFDPGLRPALPVGLRLASVLFRDGLLVVDLGEEAALAPEEELVRAISNLRHTLSLSVHSAKHIIITVGGYEPWRKDLSDIGIKSGKMQ